ncbi:MAG TPA: hypothetical protein VER12_13250 [Polyangiaceae bacterium]|nr:hypothetical protein [Polyangiaceae bacterium]
MFFKEAVMGFLGRLLGVESDIERDRGAFAPRGPATAAGGVDTEQRALERYRYMLRTAPPETLEQAHTEAFAKLTTEQRQRLLSELAQAAPSAERNAIAATPADDSQALARVATRAEVRQPGILERTLGSSGAGFGVNLLSSFAMGFVGSMVAQSFFSGLSSLGDDATDGVPDANEDHSELADSELADNGDDFDDGGDMGEFDV